MSILTRAIQKVFGETGGAGEFGQIGSKAAGSASTSKDIATIQSLTEYLQGYFSITSDQGTSRLPYSEDLNSLFYLTTRQLAYLFQSGIPEWDTDTDYYADVSIVQEGGDVYISLTGADPTPNQGNQPSLTIGTNWEYLFGKSGVYPVGSTYIQFPGDSDPATLGFPGTWSNVSSELAGDFIRFEGGDASAFESGEQLDQMQQITGSWNLGRERTGSAGVGAFSDSDGDGSSNDSANTTGNTAAALLDFNSANSPGARTGTETRAINRTVRKWRRTA